MSHVPSLLGPPVANLSFTAMRAAIRSARRGGVEMLHTARPFTFYRKVFYRHRPAAAVLADLKGKRVVDIGCGYTPYADDSMFRACHDAGVEFYGVDPLIGTDIHFGVRERLLSRATGGAGSFSYDPPGLAMALAARAEDLPFEDDSVDEILCSYLLFVWIEDQRKLARVLEEFHRVLAPGGVARLYPLSEWRCLGVRHGQLKSVLSRFDITQTFVHAPGDWRVMPSMLTELHKT